MLTNATITEILQKYGLSFDSVVETFDTSQAENDKRFNYILDNRYVLKVHSANSIWEERLRQIQRLIGRYHSIGVYCPGLIPTLSGELSVSLKHEGASFACFVEEFARYPVCRGEIVPPRKEVVDHLGRLAARFSGEDLSDIYSMWSVLDLCPLDAEAGFDEKQDNCNDLVNTLEEVGLSDLAREVADFNAALRQVIVKEYQALPRCVFQGDLNPWNELHHDGHFAGLIDFNLSGTDVNINIFLNETDSYQDQERFDSLSVSEFIKTNDEEQRQLLNVIFEHYTLNDLEKHLFPYYKRIVDMFQHPNTRAMRTWLQDPSRQNKCVELIRAFLEKPLEFEE